MKHAAISWALRVLLCGVFLLAGVPKFADPVTFVEHIANYNLLPQWAPLLAVLIPPLEITAAVTLLLAPRLWRQAAALVMLALLLGFTVALAQAFFRGINVECGCFGRGSSPIGPVTLARNLGLMAAAAFLVGWEAPGRATS